jgi:hypothetical protein
MKIKIPSWAKDKVKEIWEMTPKDQTTALLTIRKDCMEQKRKIENALNHEHTQEDIILLREMWHLFDDMERSADRFGESKRTILSYLKTVRKFATVPGSKRSRYKELIGVSDG